jgi:hypothetical protein
MKPDAAAIDAGLEGLLADRREGHITHQSHLVYF